MSAHLFAEADVNSVLDRFYRCNDGVIRRIELVFCPAREKSEATIECSVRDDLDGASWVNLICRVRGVSEFAMSEGNVSHRVLSDGLAIGWFDGLVFLDFSPYTTDPDGIDDFRRSGCYFAGESATWEVVPYNDFSNVGSV